MESSRTYQDRREDCPIDVLSCPQFTSAQHGSKSAYNYIGNSDEERDHTIKTLTERTVAHLIIEFLFTNGLKPHVVSNFTAMATDWEPNPYFKGARLSMEWLGKDAQ